MNSGAKQIVPTSDSKTVIEACSVSKEAPLIDDKLNASWTPFTVPINIESHAELESATQPLSVSIPIARGKLFSPCKAQLVSLKQTDSLSECESGWAQTQTLALWPDGSVRWLLLHFAPGLQSSGVSSREIRLAPAEKEYTTPPNYIADESGNFGRLETNRLTVNCEQDTVRFSLPESVESIAATLKLTDSQSRSHTVEFEKVEVESTGNVQTCLLLTGKVISQAVEKFTLNCRLRLVCYSDSGLARIQITLHNPRRAAHHGGLWDLGDEGSVFFRSWELILSNASPSDETGNCVAWVAETSCDTVSHATNVEIYQDSSGGENWHSPVHVNRSGRVPCQFRGYRITHQNQQAAGLRATPCVGVRGNKLLLASTVQDFWQQFPLSISADSDGIKIGLFPSQWSDQFELQGGEQKTYNVWIDVAEQNQDNPATLDSVVSSLLKRVNLPAKAWCHPEWYVSANAMPTLIPFGHGAADPTCRQILEESLVGQESLFAKRETIDEYGWRNYGDVWADHEQAYYEGKEKVVSHYNNQFDMIAGGIRQFMQSGDRTWWSFVSPLVRHVLDIDIYRTKQDRAAYNGGLFWFTDHYYSAATATHRTFSRHNAPPSKSESKMSDYGGGPGSEHNFATGLLYYYWMTGEEDAAEGVRLLADWVLAMDDGSQNVWGVFDSGPTGLASMSGSLEYQGPGRGVANSIQVLLDGWLLTREQKYLAKCEELIKRVIHPDDDITSFQLLDAERRWSYTMLLSALFRFLEVKAEEDQLDSTYAYSFECLLAYVRWMALHERPYWDQPEQLEFPTEAWAVQDLRKANVMRLAARLLTPLSAEECTLLEDRGKLIADRAWQDLQRFETRQTTRSVAIVMTEGSIDTFLRTTSSMSKLPVPVAKYDFEAPKSFIPQKIRLRSALRTPTGLFHMMLAPLRPTAWRILFRMIRKSSLE